MISTRSWISLTSLKRSQFTAVINSLGLQGEDLLPDRSQGLVLGLGLKPVVDNLHHGEGVALPAKISRVETLSFQDLENKVSHVLHIVESVGNSLDEKISDYVLTERTLHNAPGAPAPPWGPGSSWPGWRGSRA